MSYGLRVRDASGTIINDPSLFSAGFYAGGVGAVYGSSSTTTFPNVPAGGLVLYQYGPSSHNVSHGSNGSGQATVTLTPRTVSPTFASNTSYLAFARQTFESNSYGIFTLNDDGERQLSGVLPSSQFMQRVVFASTPNSRTAAYDGYFRNQHNVTASVGSTRRRLVLWSLKSTTADVWFYGVNVLGPGETVLSAIIYSQGSATYQTPEAFIFAIDNPPASSDTFGLRAYDAAGNITFDSGCRHMIMVGLPNSVGFAPTSAIDIQSYTLSAMSGITPAIFVPAYIYERWERVTPTSSNSAANTLRGVVRRRGNILDTYIVQIDRVFEDIVLNATFQYGSNISLATPIVDAVEYGGTAFT